MLVKSNYCVCWRCAFQSTRQPLTPAARSKNSVYAANLGSYTENVRIRHSYAACSASRNCSKIGVSKPLTNIRPL